MKARTSFGKEGSDESSQTNEQPVDARNIDWRPTCPECEGRVVSKDVEAVCSECGLVVSVDALEREPTLKAHAPETSDRSGEWAIEPTTALRVDNGLHTTFDVATDGKGNTLSPERKARMRRLKQRHKRFTMADDRNQRLNEGFRDIGMCGANLELPQHVTTQAARYLEAAKRERLPGGRMAWESLAAGALLLASRAAGVERTPQQIARYAKTSEERLCAAARKLRTQTDVEAPPVRDRAVDRVVAALDGTIDVATGLELVRVADRLMQIADSEPIGPGTARMTVAGAAVYTADRLTDGKALTQAEVVAAIEATVPSSTHKVASYSRQLYDAATSRRTAGNDVAMSVTAD
jgi:transcription initiation factor TFIIB